MHNQALELVKKKDFDSAIKIYLKILKKNKNDDVGLSNLAYCYLQKKKLSDSINYYLKSLKYNKTNVQSLNGLATSYFLIGNIKEAIKLYHQVIKLSPDNILTFSNLGNLYYDNKKFYLSKKYYLKIFNINPEIITSYRGIYKNNYMLRKYSETLSYLKKGLKISSTYQLQIWFLYINTYPKIHFSRYCKRRLVKRFSLVLKKINKIKDTIKVDNNKLISDAFNATTNFHLAYSVDVSNEDLKSYYNFISFFTNKLSFSNPKINIKQNNKIKIAFISKFFLDHTVLRLFKNFFLNLSNSFEVFIIHIDNYSDHFTKKLKIKKINYFQETDFYKIVDFLKQNNFDIIFYPEIGMDPLAQTLASMRFAKVQCVCWGHPISTGSKNIDYFISSELMEPSNARINYTEKLVLLPGTGIDVDSEMFPKSKFLKNVNLIRKKIIILQSLFKILPEDLDIYFNILNKKNDIEFYFIKDLSNYSNLSFMSLLEKNFLINDKNKGLNFNNHFFLLDRMKRHEFIKNIRNYDLVLDTYNWSGGNTHLEALLSGAPVVTCPTHLMRGRHTYAFLKKMGVEELIANSKEHFCEVVIKLLEDDVLYKAILEKIESRNYLLYDNGAVDSLENFFKSVIK